MSSLASRLDVNKRFEFVCSIFPKDDKFDVVKMEGYESISRPFRFTLTLVSDDPNIDFDAMLQTSCTFRITAPDTSSVTPYHGVLAEFEQLHQANGYYFYRAVLVPRLWRLSLFRISEVYLNEQTIPQIIAGILKENRLTSNDYELRLTGNYRERSFVCQFQETHLDFISRWMEKEGIAYFFDHEGTAERIIIVDDKAMHPVPLRKLDYRPVDTLDTGLSSDSVQSFICRQKPLPNKVILQDFNHRKADVELKVDALVSDKGIGEVMIYGENFRDLEEGRRYAKIRAQEILSTGKVFSGEATAVGLRCGYFIELAHHYRDDFNGRYLVTEIAHEGSQAGALLTGIHHPFGGPEGETIYRNIFSAIPESVQLRPARETPKPRVAGTMNATIDAEGTSDYADLDEYGQYKVQLPFDRTEKAANKASARVRMASPYAGSKYGMHFPLKKNAEVLLSFTDGDPDQPVIMAAVPNSEAPNVVTSKNPAENRITTAGGNQFYMDDTKNKEVIWLRSPYSNAQMGIGANGADPAKHGIWLSTSGSSESITVGSNNSVFFGVKNSVSVSFENSLSASFANKLALGTSVNFTAGSDISWKKGRSVSIDDSESVSLKTDSKLQANNTVLISGGQRTAIKTMVEALKTKVKYIVGFNIAANVAAAAGAAGYIGSASDQKDGKMKPWEPGSYGVTAAQAGLSAISVAAVHLVLRAAANAITEALKADSTYASNLKIDGDGINMTVDSLAPVENASISIKKNQIALQSLAMTGPGISKLIVLPNQINLSANGAGLVSELDLSATAAKLSTQNPAGTVLLEQPTGGSVKIDASSVVAQSAAAETALMRLRNDTAMLEFGSGNGFFAKANKVSAAYLDVAKMELTVHNAALKFGPSELTINGAGAKVNGALIQLG